MPFNQKHARLAALLDVPLVQAAQNVVPVSATAAESVERLRTWASGRCLDADRGGKYLKGTPVFFFVVLPPKKGPDNKRHMSDLEKFLIQTGVAANPDLLNVKGTRQQEWSITGVLRSGAGKPKKGASLFRKMMKLPKR